MQNIAGTVNHDVSDCSASCTSADNSNVCVLQEQGFNGVNVGCLNRQDTLKKSMPSKNIIHSVESTNSVSTNDTSSATDPAIGYRCLQPFGFIKRVENISKYHLNDFSRSVVAGSNKEWVQKAHKIVVDSGTSNYKSARVLVKTDLNLKLWAEILKDYHDPQLLDYLRFGFPLCVNYDAFQHAPSTVNHLSATRFPDDVNIYFSTELAHNSIARPFGSVPFENFHVSPLLTRPKNNDSRRVIVNLSYPEGRSVNSNIESEIYDGYAFDLSYPTIDNIVDEISKVGDNVLLYKLDISRAFRNLRIEPRDYGVMGLQWERKFYVDISVAFGYKHGSAQMQRLGDTIRHIMTSQQYAVFPYIDDIIGVQSAVNAQKAFDTLKALVDNLGLPINPKKLVSPAKQVVCMGILVDVENNILRIPEEKMLEIKSLCNKWAYKTSATRQQLQSLLGKLLYIHRCVRPSRLFVNRMLALLRNSGSSHSIHLTSTFQHDVAWFNVFLDRFNGKTMIHNQGSPHIHAFMDASLSGVGAIWEDNVYAATYPPGFTHMLSIVHLELINIWVMLNIWGKYWKNKLVKIWCDNEAVVHILTSGKTRDEVLALYARSIWLFIASYDIQTQYSHVQGVNNVYADRLSRWFFKEY